MILKLLQPSSAASKHRQIVTISSVMFILTLFFIFNVKTAHASEVQVTFTGTVISIMGSGVPGINLDDPVSGTVIYDSTIMDIHPSLNIGYFPDAIISYDATIGSKTYTLAPSSPYDISEIVVLDNLESSIGYDDMIEFEDAVFENGGTVHHYLQLMFSTRTETPSSWIETSSILPTDLNLNAAENKGGKIALNPTSSTDMVIFRISNAIMKLVPTTITIDIKPRKKSEDVISLKKDKNLKVAIVGEEAFDALQVDPTTVKFGSNEASPVRFKGQDYDRDGFPDLILTFKLNETGIACGDNEATLTGETYGREAIEGSDDFTVEPCP